MKEFDECLEIRRKIDEIDENIETITAAALAPKSQAISDMPRGSGTASETAIDKYIIKKEELQCKRDELLDVLNNKWFGDAIKIMADSRIHTEDIDLMQYRFYHGYPWKKCAAEMKKHYGERWNINRVFRTYRKVLSKCTK